MVLIAGIDPGLQFATFAAIFKRAKIPSTTFDYYHAKLSLIWKKIWDIENVST